MMELSLFEGDNTLPPAHENQLTRALLALLRLSPAIHAAFVDLIRERQQAGNSKGVIPPYSALGVDDPIIQTQVGSLPLESGVAISTLLTDEHFTHTRDVARSNRRPVFDGVIAYPPDWQVVIENKPRSADVWEEQLSFPVPDGVAISPVPVDLRWSDVIARVSALDARCLLCHAEAVLVSDFLDFVAKHFEFLNPYTDFLVCKRLPSLMRKRCHALLAEMGAGEVVPRRGTGDPRVLDLKSGTARFVSVWYDEEDQRVAVGMWPADTLNQAREFRDHAKRSAFIGLKDTGWSVEPNLHFAHIQQHKIWVHGTMTLERYWDYWYSKTDRLAQARREDFRALFDSLGREGAVTNSEREDIKKIFSTFNSLNPCPGFEVIFRWPVAEAERLDNKGQFAAAMRGKVVEAMATWGQRLGDSDA